MRERMKGKLLPNKALFRIFPGLNCHRLSEIACWMNTNKQNVSQKSRLVALLLSFFGGYFGVHRFYVGKIGTGILMIAVTISMFVPSIITMARIMNHDSRMMSGDVPSMAAPAGWLLFCGLILTVWTWADVIMIAVGTFSDKQGNKLLKWLE